MEGAGGHQVPIGLRSEVNARPRRCPLSKPVLAGQQAARRRTEGCDGHPFFHRERQDLVLDGAFQQAVTVLHRLVPMNAQPVAGGQGVTQLLGRDIAGPDMPYFSRVHQVVHRLQRLFDWRGRIGLHDDVEVEVVGLEAAEAALDRLHDVAS